MLLAQPLSCSRSFKIVNNIKNYIANASVLNAPCHILHNTNRVIYLSLSTRFEIEHDFFLFYLRVVFLRIPPTDFRCKNIQKCAGLQVMFLLLRFDSNKSGIRALIFHVHISHIKFYEKFV